MVHQSLSTSFLSIILLNFAHFLEEMTVILYGNALGWSCLDDKPLLPPSTKVQIGLVDETLRTNSLQMRHVDFTRLFEEGYHLNMIYSDLTSSHAFFCVEFL